MRDFSIPCEMPWAGVSLARDARHHADALPLANLSRTELLRLRREEQDQRLRDYEACDAHLDDLARVYERIL